MTESYRKAMEKFDKKMEKKKAAQRKKADKILARDFKGSAGECRFYINQDYKNPYTQAEWLKLYKELSSQDNPEVLVPMYNAIVVDSTGHYLRKGLQWMLHNPQAFCPGENDMIPIDYAVEPYTYNKNPAKPAAAPSRSYSRPAPTPPQPQPQSQPKPLTFWDKQELRSAQRHYESCVNSLAKAKRNNMDAGSIAYWEGCEKKALAKLLSVQAKYAGRE